MTKVLNIKSSSYFHRDYKNDLPKKDDKNIILNQVQRVGLVALPFISLYKPFGKTLAIGTSTARALSCSAELISSIKSGCDSQKISKAALDTALAISSIAGTILLHPLGMLITTGHDLTLNSYHIFQAIVEGNNDKLLQETLNMANNIFYLLTMTHGSLEYQILSLACQAILGSYSSFKEFKKGNYFEFTAHVLMSAIRTNQMIAQVQTLNNKWKLEALIKENKNNDFKNVSCALGASTALSQALTKYKSNDEKIPAFHSAIKNNDLNAVKLFLDTGTSPNARSRQMPDFSAYDSFDYPDSALDFAAAFADETIVNLLIKRGAILNPQPITLGIDKEIWIPNSPLQYAARFSNTKATEALLKQGADPYYYAFNGTPIHIAARYGSVEILKLFKKLNIDLSYDAKNADRDICWMASSPLNYAIHSDDPGSISGVKALLELGVKIEQDYRGAYPLWVCANSTPLDGCTEKMKLLLKYGANPDYKHINGESVLHRVITFYDSVKIMVESGCDVNIKNDEGLTPLGMLNYCVGKDINKIKQFLISRGAKE